MRLLLKLRPTEPKISIPINYQYPLSAIIYKILSHSSPEYSEFLHNSGYVGTDGKLRKLFTFSRLLVKPRARLIGQNLQIAHRHDIRLYISSPMIQDFVQHLVVGLFQSQVVEIGNGRTSGRLHIEQVQVCPTPEFSSRHKFKALSPIVVSRAIERHGRLSKHYIRPDEPALQEQLRRSLVKKYQTVHQKPPGDSRLELEMDLDYIKKKGGAEKTMTLVQVKQGQPGQTNIKGFLAPFTLAGSPELIQTAWECGLGDQCSLGFGCVEVVEPKTSDVYKTSEA